MLGSSTGFKQAFDLLSRASKTQVTVLLLGETGVGKERFAQALHQMSTRSKAPFVAINCAALPHDLIESELFGVEKGAFTGAQYARLGKFERADGGTLFLDEIGELPLAAQAKLLRVLQDGEIERLGDDRVRKVDIRLVAATNVDLQAAVNARRFRQDLLYRLNVYPISIPPLRERLADIPLLIGGILERLCARHDKAISRVSDQAMQAITRYEWPGNVRELENVIERGIVLAQHGGNIELEHLFPHMCDENRCAKISPGSEPRDERPKPPINHRLPFDALFNSGLSIEEIEHQIIEEAVRRANGNLSRAARQLGITRPKLQYRIKRRTS